MNHTKFRDNTAVYAGFASVLIFSIGPAFNRTLAESLSTFTTGAIVNTVAGLLMLLYRQKTCPLCPIRETNPRYWVLCATSFVAFMVLSNAAVGLSETREIAVISGLVHSLWPLSALLLAIPIGKAKARPALIIGVLLCIVGIVLANYSGGSLQNLISGVADAALPMSLAAIACLMWGIYSNILPRTISSKSADYLPVVSIAAGLVQLLCALLAGERIVNFGFSELLQLLFMAVVSSFLGNYFWNLSMQSRGRMQVIFFSNLTPALTTFFSILLLGLKMTLPILLGSVLIVLGAIWCKACFKKVQP